MEYIGETARTMFDRGEEHIDDLIAERKGKPVWEHISEEHGGTYKVDWFKMKIILKHRSMKEEFYRQCSVVEYTFWLAA